MSTPSNVPIESSSRGSLLRWLPFAALAVAAMLLAMNWDSIPERWIIHWGARGEPDGWAAKTPFQVYLPVGMGAAICAFLELIASVVASRRKPGAGFNASPEAISAIARATADFVRLINVVLSITFACIAVRMPLYPMSDPRSFLGFILALIAVAILLGVYRMKRAFERLRREGKLEGLKGWNGLIYRNPDDERLWVPKLTGLGYTFNFAHPWAWPLFLFMLSVPVTILLLVFLFAK
jgi:uncharacterized membrane protein